MRTGRLLQGSAWWNACQKFWHALCQWSDKMSEMPVFVRA